MYTAQAYIYIVYWLVAGLFRGFVDKGYSWGCGYVLVFMFMLFFHGWALKELQ